MLKLEDRGFPPMGTGTTRIFRAALLAAFLLALLQSAAFALVPKPMTGEQMAEKAGLIAVVRVREIAETGERGRSLGDAAHIAEAKADIEEILKGSATGTLSIRFLNPRYRLTPSPVVLKKNERALVFLRFDPQTGQYAFITDYQGKEKPDPKRIGKLKKDAEKSGHARGVFAELDLENSVTKDGRMTVEFRVWNRSGAAVPMVLEMDPSAILTLVHREKGAAPSIPKPRADTGGAKRLPTILQNGQFAGFHAQLADLFELKEEGVYRLGAAYNAPPPSDPQLAAWSGVVAAPEVEFVYRGEKPE